MHDSTRGVQIRTIAVAPRKNTVKVCFVCVRGDDRIRAYQSLLRWQRRIKDALVPRLEGLPEPDEIAVASVDTRDVGHGGRRGHLVALPLAVERARPTMNTKKVMIGKLKNDTTRYAMQDIL